MYVNSNMTPREAFNLHGALPPAMIEKLITDVETKAHINFDDIEDYISMALDSYPEDDDLMDSEVIRRCYRGKAALLKVLELLKEGNV